MNTLRKLLNLLEKKHPGQVYIILYSDESGRIIDNYNLSRPYDSVPLFNFSSLKELKAYLESEDDIS